MITCDKCGAVLEDGMKFCIACGNKLPEATETTAPVEAVETVAPVEETTEAEAVATEATPVEEAADEAQPYTPPQPETYVEPVVTPTPVATQIPVAAQVPQPVPQFTNNAPVAPKPQPEKKNEQVIGIGGWIGTFVLLCLPLINLIMIIVWACGGSKYKSKVNFARAALIIALAAAILLTAFTLVCVLVFRSQFDSFINWITNSINDFAI